MKIKKNNWGEISLNDYNRIVEIIDDETLSDAEKDIALISILCEVPEDEIWALTIDEVIELKRDMLFLEAGFTYPNLSFKKIKIGNWNCTINPDLSKLTYAQFVDFQTYVKDVDKQGHPKKRAEILSVFFIPEGHKYGDGYNIAELQQAIGENISILTYNSVWSFFTERSRSSLSHLATSLAYKMRARAILMRKSNPLKEKYKEMAKTLMAIPNIVG